MGEVTIGIIGGSGLYQMEGLSELREQRITTPFGDPSDAYLVGRLGGAQVVFLARHGRGHRFNPSEVNYRANIFGMKMLGVSWLISVSAVGSLREEIVPGHLVMVDQFIDRTRGRASSFFTDGIVAHVAFGDPVCEVLRGMLLAAARQEGFTAHSGGTYVCMEGPAFSTRAESELHRSMGGSVIGMTNIPEAKLAREAEMSYATIAMATDYDCWHPRHDQVTVDQVVALLQKNATTAQRTIQAVIPRILAHEGPAPQSHALATAILTQRDALPAGRLAELAPIIGKYFS